MRASVRSRLRWRMISWPAAKQIRCVKPSIATVSPSWTSSATASCIDATLVIGRSQLRASPAVLRAPEDAELVALGVEHDRPERPLDVDPSLDRRAELDRAFDLPVHGVGRANVEVQTVLHDLALGHLLEVQALEHGPVLALGRPEEGTLLVEVEPVRLALRPPERRHPEPGQALGVGAVDRDGVEDERHDEAPVTSATASSKTSSAVST